MIEKKIYSAVDAIEELVGTYGWFGNTVLSVLEQAGDMNVTNLRELRCVNGTDCSCRFKCYDKLKFSSFSLYYPVCHKKNLEAYKAWTEGKNVYALKDGEKHWYSSNCGAKPDFLNDEKLYAVDEEAEPEKKYVPFDTVDEFVEASGVEVADGSRPLIWVRSKDMGIERIVTGYDAKTTMVFVGVSFYMMEEMFNSYTFLDGSPCGKEADQ